MDGSKIAQCFLGQLHPHTRHRAHPKPLKMGDCVWPPCGPGRTSFCHFGCCTQNIKFPPRALSRPATTRVFTHHSPHMGLGGPHTITHSATRLSIEPYHRNRPEFKSLPRLAGSQSNPLRPIVLVSHSHWLSVHRSHVPSWSRRHPGSVNSGSSGDAYGGGSFFTAIRRQEVFIWVR